MNEEQYLAIGKALADLLDILEQPSPYQAACDCGWRGLEWDDEADAQAEAWAHMPCNRPHYAACECGWIGEERDEETEAFADWDAHLEAEHAGH